MNEKARGMSSGLPSEVRSRHGGASDFLEVRLAAIETLKKRKLLIEEGGGLYLVEKNGRGKETRKLVSVHATKGVLRTGPKRSVNPVLLLERGD